MTDDASAALPGPGSGAGTSPLVEAFERLVPAAQRDGRALPALEAALEALYAAALHGPRNGAVVLEAHLARHVDRHPAIDAWCALLRLRLARREAGRGALLALDLALAPASSRTRWIVSVEAARLVAGRVGLGQAWARVRDVAPFCQEDTWREGPMAVSAVLVWLQLAGGAGDWGRHDDLARVAQASWPEGAPPAIRVGLLIADQAIQRGRYREAIQRVRRLSRLREATSAPTCCARASTRSRRSAEASAPRRAGPIARCGVPSAIPRARSTGSRRASAERSGGGPTRSRSRRGSSPRRVAAARSSRASSDSRRRRGA